MFFSFYMNTGMLIVMICTQLGANDLHTFQLSVTIVSHHCHLRRLLLQPNPE